MSEFDPTEYFNRQAANNQAASNSGDAQDKFTAIINAKRRAITALEGQAVVAKQKELARKSSWAGQLGLDTREPAGQVVNLGASAYSGASRVVGDVAGFVAGDLEAMLRDSTLSENEIGAIGRYRRGEATDQDVDMITARRSAGAHSPLDMADKADAARLRSANINDAFDRTDTVDMTRRDALTNQLGENFQSAWDQTKAGAKDIWGGDIAGSKDLASGMARLVFNAGEAAVSNPGAAAEYIAENIPQLAIGAFGTAGKGALLISNAGYASENYQKGIAKYQTENKGAYPPAEERQKMALYAASLAVAEHVMDTSLLKGIGGAAKAAEKEATSIVKSLNNSFKTGLGGAAGEAVTEGWQTFAEGEANGTPATALDVYTGAAIGAASGGGMAGGGRLVAEAVGATPEQAAQRKVIQTQREAQATAMTTGDVTALLDPKSAVYAPHQAILALQASNERPDASPEAKQANLEKATGIVAGLEKDRADLQAMDLADLPPKDADVVKQMVSKLDRRIEQAQEAMARFHEDSQPAELDVAVEAVAINSTTDVASVPARADRIINLSMAIPERLSTEVATQLAENPNNGLSEAQRTYFRTFSEARLAENKAKDVEGVSQEVLYGSKKGAKGTKYVGMQQYRTNVGTALAAGNKKLAEQYLGELTSFATDHQAKADAAAKALSNGPGAQIMRVNKGPWQVLEQRRPSAEVSSNGGLSLHDSPKSKALFTSIAAEAAVVNATASELTAAIAVKFPTKSKPATGAANVTNVPKPPAVPQAPVDEPQAPQGAGSDRSTEAVGGVPAAGVRTATVADVGVTQSTEATSVDQKAAPLALVTDSSVDERIKGKQQSKEETVSDTETTDSSKSAEQTRGLNVFRKENVAALPNGTLLGSIYRTVNKAALFLSQRQSKVSKDSDVATARPLVDVTDMLTQWNDDAEFPKSFFDGVEKFSEAEQSALDTFKLYANKWSNDVWSNFIKGSLPNEKGNTKKADQLFRDPVQDFFNEDGTMEENVVTAVMYGAYSYLVDSAMAPALKNREDVLKMHGLQEDDTPPTSEDHKELMRLAAFEDAAVNTIGDKIVAALGLKAKPGAPQDYLPKVAAAFGVHALQLLQRQGLINIKVIDGGKLASYLPAMGIQPIGKDRKTNKDVYAKYSYVQVVRDLTTHKMLGDGKVITESVAGSSGVIDKLFDAEHVPMEASTEPIPFKQQFAKRTGQTISKIQRKILTAAQKQENRIIPDMWSALKVLGDGVILKAAGWKDLDGGKISANNLSAYEAQNNNLENQLEGMKGRIDPDNLSQPFFANFEVWKNFRVGVTTRDLNLQSSKIHRFMFFRPEWESTVKMDDDYKVGSFLVSVAQAMGVKIDQKPNAEMLEDKFINGELKDEATNTLARKLADAIAGKGELNDATKQDIADLASGAEGMQTLQGLVAYGKYLQAKDAGAETFTATMLVGVDGKTNGPILTHLALGAAASKTLLQKMLARGGMYSEASGVQNFNHWYKQAGSLDLYEDLAGVIIGSLSPKTKGLAAIEVITKDLLNQKTGKATGAGRKIVKTPLTSFAFGSSIAKSLENMQAAFVQAVSDRIEDLANGTDKDLTKASLIASINELMVMGGLPSSDVIPADYSLEELLEWQIVKEQGDALTKAFDKVLGGTVLKTMKSYFEVFTKRRNAVNVAIQSSFGIYQAIYQDLRNKEMARLIESGEIDSVMEKGKKIPLFDLTVEQESALRQKVASVLPQAHTAYSAEGGDLGSGLMMSKDTRGMSQQAMHQIEVQMGIPTKRSDGGMSVQVKSQTVQKAEINPGVAGLPYMMHSLDSFIMHMAMEGTESLNVHDEKANGFDRVEDTAQRINGSTWTAMLNYSPATQAYEMLERAIANAATMHKAGDVSNEALMAIESVLQGLLTEKQLEANSGKTLVRVALSNAKAAEFAANEMRLDTMSEMGSFDQYTWEGGEYEVTEADRAEAVKLLEAARKQGGVPSDASIGAAKDLGQAILDSFAEPAVTPAKFEADPVVTEQASPFGTLGKPPQLNADLVAYFKANPEVTGKEAIAKLRSMISASTGYHGVLLDLLTKAMPSNIKVKLITPSMTEKDVIEKFKGERAFGWIVGNEIYIKSEDFVESGLVSPEVLLHELVHAALIDVIEHPGKAAQVLVKQLNSLMAEAAAYAKQHNITEFDSALNDVHEFVAYGMTRTSFQKLLAQVSAVAPDQKSNVLINGFKRFISTLTELMFTHLGMPGVSKKDQANTALGGLIENVTGLLNQAEKNAAKGTTASGSVNLSMAIDPMGAVKDYSTLDIYSALNAGSMTTKFDAHLRGVLNTIVGKLQGPFGVIREVAKADRALTAMDVWVKALDTGKAPFASSVQGSPMKASKQEEFTMEMVEATVRAALDRSETSSKIVYRQIDKLYTEMRESLKGKMPQDQYDFVFSLEQGADKRSNHLARFAAYGLAHEGFNKALQVSTKIELFPKHKTIAQKLQAVFEAIVEFFYDKVTKTYAGQKADEKLTTLVGTLVDIEAKKLANLARPDPAFGKYAGIEKMARTGLTARMKAVRAAAKSDVIANSRFGVVRTLGQFALLADPQKVEQVIQGLSAVRSKNFEGRLGFVAGTMNYAIGFPKIFEALLRHRKMLEGERKDIITNISKMTFEAFVDGGAALKKDLTAAGAVTQVFLRTGMHVLTDQFNMTEIENLLGDRPALLAAISTLEAQLNPFSRFKDDYIDKANALAYHKVTGEVRIESLLMNAHSIANLHGSPYRKYVTPEQANQVEPIIEKLIALYAIDHSDRQDLVKARDVLKTENARTDGGGNGVSFVMSLQKRLDQEALARNFHDNRTLMVHGHTPEIYDPYVDVKTVTLVEGVELEAMGYTKQGKVPTDPADPSKEAKYLYALNDGGLMPHLTGVIAYNGLSAKGTKQHSGYMNVNTSDGLDNASLQAEIMGNKTWNLYQGPRRDLSKVKQTYMAPVLNGQGEIVNWRYMMQDSTKNSLLKRDNRFSTVLGVLAGSIFDKETVAETNNKAIQALKDQYDLDKKVSLDGYVSIGPKSIDKQDRETWAMLPPTTKAEVLAIWGTEGLRIHHNARDIIFGYRKLSLADAVTNTQERREWAAMGIAMPKGGWDDQLEVALSHVLTMVAEHFFGKKAATKIRKGERVWQEIVQETKDLVVVKSFTTLAGNVKSNFSLLFLSGVPPWAILKHHLTAWRGATSYGRDSKELFRLQTLIDTKQTNGKEAEMKQSVIRFEDAISRNPVRLLIENGLMPSIVEDTSEDDDIYSYKSLLARKVSGVTDKAPKLLVDAAKQVYLAKDTTAYQTLRHMTALSDFMARYTQYQHLTTRRKNPLSSADAIQQASDDFVNYDLPMHRSMQWLDDTGIFMFSKYYIRIQKVISRMFKENTVRMLGALALGSYMDLGPIVLDSSWVAKFGNNPLNWGALQYPGSLGELSTVNSAMALIK